MVYTLLLRLAGPLQSWGIDSKFNIRTTQLEPSKSGVIGLIAAALGRRRNESLEDLVSLRFGVRIDQPGSPMIDFHTANKGDKSADNYVTSRYYLQDAVFLVGIEHNNMDFLKEIDRALKSPTFPLFLGRRSCPVTLPLNLGIRDMKLEDALRAEPWLASEWMQSKNDTNLFIITEPEAGETCLASRRDVPISFDKSWRQYAFRGIKSRGSISVPKINENTDITDTSQDPLSELEE